MPSMSRGPMWSRRSSSRPRTPRSKALSPRTGGARRIVAVLRARNTAPGTRRSLLRDFGRSASTVRFPKGRRPRLRGRCA
ncbi:hypothetical protein [Lysobacter gummosus]|uniref:hypothetical protein n=1 Tax=Lysobacter gummosus TaxID=262324 RepID=UPI003644B7CF